MRSTGKEIAFGQWLDTVSQREKNDLKREEKKPMG